ncbi:hypothetical protein CLOSPI_02164 [Thomasclavelia spiroformis DSM 1552]|uniref:Uncharacterized protein n=1 Tax=Thomasclavelia spiroformis DSM 1552 TaxID=428126 RepID=B1C4Z5_9FIRM|nr:hypothetical protein CLOSPI_02164 [Thomasclavelia spiroformis DSM 1552]
MLIYSILYGFFYIYNCQRRDYIPEIEEKQLMKRFSFKKFIFLS